jgi:hypothetical protein
MDVIGPMFALIIPIIATIVIIRMFLESSKSKREAEAQLQLHTRLLDRFGSPAELLEYLRSDAGKQFLAPAAAQKTVPYRRILAATQAGVVLVFVGVGFWLVRGSFGSDGRQLFTFLAATTFAFGLGFLCSAVLAHILSRKWGLLNGNGATAGKEQ